MKYLENYINKINDEISAQFEFRANRYYITDLFTEKMFDNKLSKKSSIFYKPPQFFLEIKKERLDFVRRGKDYK